MAVCLAFVVRAAGDPDLRFVELYNSNPYPERIGGFVLSGGLSFAFPSGYVFAGTFFRIAVGRAL